MPSIQAIVFDVDGLMIDTERLGYRIFQEILAERGIHLGDEHYVEIIGLDQFDTAVYLVAQTGVALSPAALNELYYARFELALLNRLEPNPGLPELLAELRRRRIPLGIASNSPVGYLARVLRVIHAERFFQVVVGRDLVAAGKPAPDVYLGAAERLGVSPAVCLAIEDSAVGMQSALAAGMRCAVVNEQPDGPAFARATTRYTSLPALQAALDELLSCKDEG
jgi:HAD superfamily hydrolase (TIGR01509 family)